VITFSANRCVVIEQDPLESAWPIQFEQLNRCAKGLGADNRSSYGAQGRRVNRRQESTQNYAKGGRNPIVRT
jgi:hypothetical protein